jgi:GntR family transcriptional regulator/MocR family aminotransferase
MAYHLSELFIDIDSAPRRATAIERALRGAVLSGRLAPGSRLPSSRVLALELGCARATVVGAYEQLVAEGYLVAKAGSGTTVGSVGTAESADVDAAGRQARPFTELLPGEPDPSSFPRGAWLASLRRVLRSSPDDLFGYGDHRGQVELRRALASYLGRSRAVVADPSRVVVFGGFASALSILAATFHRLGIDRVAIEEPCLPPHARAIAGAGPRLVSIPVDDDGIRVSELGDERVVVCTPAHQYPMGVVLSAARRAALVDWARAGDAWIVEDDYDGEFRYDRRAIGAMQGLDPDRVIYGGTASKSLAPGLGLAWLVLPPMLVDPVLETKRLRRLAVSTIDQAALADFIASGALDRHIRTQRVAYRRRRDDLVRLLAERAPWLDVTGISAGLHVTALLHDRDERAVIEAAARHSVALFGIGDHCIGTPARAGLVVGYSRSPAHAFPAALDRLAGVLDAC